jgi:PKD repeat protein
MPTRIAAAALLTGLMAIGACSSKRDAPVPASPGSLESTVDLPQSAGLPDLAELAELLDVDRDDSIVNESLISFAGNQFREDLPRQNAYKGLMNLGQFVPYYIEGPGSPSQEIAYAMYAFHAQEYDRLPQVRLDWNGTADAQDWLLGLANWQSGRWDMLPGTVDETLEFDKLDPYFSSEGNLLAAVIVLGDQLRNLTSIRLGQPGPLAVFSTTALSGKLPLQVTFKGGQSSSPNGSIVNFSFDPQGDGPIDNGSNPDFLHTYTIPGWYRASCTVTDESGLSSEKRFDVFVEAAANLAPVASFTATPVLGEAPLPVVLDASASTDADGSIASYLWDFQNDGIIDLQTSDPVAQHTYAGFGNFTIKLTVLDDSFGIGTKSNVISVVANGNYNPVGDFTWLMDSAYAPASVMLSAAESIDNDGFIVNYEWDLDDDGAFEVGGPDKMEVPVQYQLPGSYPVTLRVTDDEGLQGFRSKDVLILEGWQRTIGRGFNDEFVSAISDGQGGVLACGTILDASGEPEDVNVLLARFGPAGELQWVRSLDLGYVERGTGLALNDQGVIMVVGQGVNQTFKTDYAIVSRWDLTGSLLSSKFVATLTADESATAVVAAADDFIVSGRVEVEATGVINTAFWRFDSAGSLLWASQLGALIDVQPAALSVLYDAGNPAASRIFGLCDLTPVGLGSMLVQLDLDGNLIMQRDILSQQGPCRGTALLIGADEILVAGNVETGNTAISFIAEIDGMGTILSSSSFNLFNRFVPGGLCRTADNTLYLSARGLSNNPGGIGLARLDADLKITEYLTGKWPGKVVAPGFLASSGDWLLTGGIDEQTGSYWSSRSTAPAELDITLSDAAHDYSNLGLAYLNITATVTDPTVVKDSGGGGSDASLHLLKFP